MKGTRFKELILQEGTILADRYEVRDMISISVYYTIYQVWDRKKQIICAMKEYFPQDISARMPDGKAVPIMQKYWDDFEDGCLRFTEESEILFHLDIDPDHVMITKDFHAVLTGFGNLSKLGERRNSGTKYDNWEPPFTMPPEQGSSHMAKGAYSDVYSLAAVVFYLMTGRTIPRFTERLREQNSVVSLQEIKPEIPQRISDALIHALEFKVPQRTQSMKRFKEELGVEWFLAEQETSPQYTIMNWDGS